MNSFQILGAHGHQEESHEEGEDEEGHEEHNDDKEYIWKMLVSCVSVWAFIILQMVIQGVGQLIEAKKEKKVQRFCNWMIIHNFTAIVFFLCIFY